MKKSITLLVSGILLLSVAACNNAQTTGEAPDSTKDEIKIPTAKDASEAKEDATSETRRNQLNADIKAREERNNALNDGTAKDRDDSDVASEVRSKLEANLPASALVVDAKDGSVIISGTVPTQEQYDKIANLAKEIKGVQSVDIKAAVAPAKPGKNN
ncbi:BON domain-containing protein [Nostoc sp. UHCC 0302]|uniref:BON domain-containing protein n=1 Tax=Nostoc sp. UHCC 0302 TaxID=3134896 RepID=UPI00311CC12F